MELESIRVSDVIPIAPARLYEAWMDGPAHSAFTGSIASVEPGVGGKFTAWEGYISGETLELVPGEKIVQSWRATDFPADAAHSKIVILFAEDPGGTLLTIEHTELPPGMGKMYDGGWKDFYFKPMKKHYAALAKKAAAEAKKAAAAKKAVAKKVVAPAKKAVAPAKKAVAKKVVAPAKKAVAKKVVAPAKKAVAPAKKAVAKKAVAATKKAVAKKAAPAAKKAVAKKAAR